MNVIKASQLSKRRSLVKVRMALNQRCREGSFWRSSWYWSSVHSNMVWTRKAKRMMVPVVERSADAEDQRKGKCLRWKEVRLNLAHPKGRVTLVFGGHFAGGVEESGRQ